MAHLDSAVAKWNLLEFDEAVDDIKEIDLADRGNMRTRLGHCINEEVVRGRFTGSY